MRIKLLQALVGFFCMTVILLQGSESYPASSEGGPIIHVRQISHTFPPVFEGEKLSHTFAVFNSGTVDLNIRKVSQS